MKKPLKIINVDGTRGSGVTTQANMLAMKLKKMHIPTLLIDMNSTADLISDNIDKIKKFIEKNPNGMVVNDGSIARVMTSDIINLNMTRREILEKYKKVLHEYGILDHEHGIANLLIVLDDINACNKRILRENELLNEDKETISDLYKEREIVNNLKSFNNSIISRDIEFKVFEIDVDDSIMDVHDELIEYLEDNYDITIEKPSQV